LRSSNNTITNNNAWYNGYGIDLYSSNNNLVNNTMLNNGIDVGGTH